MDVLADAADGVDVSADDVEVSASAADGVDVLQLMMWMFQRVQLMVWICFS